MHNQSYDNKWKGSNATRAGESAVIAGRVPPHAKDAEIAVLGAMMLDRQAVAKVVEILEPECFYHESHKILFTVMLGMFERGVPVDMVTLTDEIKSRGLMEQIGGVFYITEINSRTPSSANVEYHARIVLEKHLKRSLIQTANKILEDSYDESTDALEEIDRAEAQIFAIAEKRLKKSYMSMKKLAFEAYELIQKLSERDHDGLTGVPSGLIELDNMTGGFQNSDLIIIAARPSMGKTALALSMARNTAVVYKQPVAFFSIEMAAIQLVIRLLSAEAKIDQQKIRTGKIAADDNRRIIEALGKLSDAPIVIDDSPVLTVMELRAKCRRLKAEHDIKLVVVDYLQLIQSPKAESREREISMISQSLKQIAKELNIPVIALAQLNRSVEARSDKRPMLSDLRESGSIEQDADVVMFVNRPEQYGQTHFDDEHKTPTEGIAELIIGKQRNGPVGTVRVAFQKNYARFENLIFMEAPPDAGPGFGGAGQFNSLPPTRDDPGF